MFVSNKLKGNFFNNSYQCEPAKYTSSFTTVRRYRYKNNVLPREEKTKVTKMFIRNPYNKYRPSRISNKHPGTVYIETIVLEIIHLSCILAFDRLSTITSQLIFS